MGVLVSQLPGYENIYPTHAIIIGNVLFICGYATPLNTIAPGYPNYTDPKVVVVLSYDLTLNVVTNAQYTDFVETSTLTSGSNYDYDMALRMKEMSNGQIMVTGSCNAVHPDFFGNDQFLSGTLSMMVDPVTLSNVNNPYSSANTIQTPQAGGEFGVDIMEDPTAPYYYIFGNNFLDGGGGGSYMGMDPVPNFFHASSVTAGTLAFVPNSPLRYGFNGFDHAWALNVLPGNTANTYTVAGMQDNMLAGCGPIPSSASNVNPFLAELSLNTPFNIIGSVNYWSTQMSTVGTGSPGLPNCYHNLGDGLSNYGWNSPFAARQPAAVSTDITMAAPVWDIAGGLLTYKFIRTDLYGNQIGCSPTTSTSLCPGSFSTSNIYDNTNPFTGTQIVSTSNDMPIKYLPPFIIQDAIYPYMQLDCNMGYYRGGNSAGASQAEPKGSNSASYTIAPNPATDKLVLSYTGIAQDAAVTVWLADMTGRTVATLYDGKAAGLAHSLPLPLLATGLYTFHILKDGKELPTQKLTIK